VAYSFLGWFRTIWDGFDRTMVVYWSRLTNRHVPTNVCEGRPVTHAHCQQNLIGTAPTTQEFRQRSGQDRAQHLEATHAMNLKVHLVERFSHVQYLPPSGSGCCEVSKEIAWRA
jgi:hypothetical protein